MRLLAKGLAPALLMIAAPADAEIYCVGTVAGVHTTISGDVLIQPEWHGGWVQICNLNQAWKEVPLQTCWAWFSQVNNGMSNDQRHYIYYLLQEGTPCAGLPPYAAAPAPYYIMNLDNNSALQGSPPPKGPNAR